jgi:hypothetical protein
VAGVVECLLCKHKPEFKPQSHHKRKKNKKEEEKEEEEKRTERLEA